MSAIEVIKKVAKDEVDKLNLMELGVVTSIFPHASGGDNDNYECNVMLPHRNMELRRVPIATQHIGLACVPNVGNMVIVGFIGGDIKDPVVIGRLYNDEDRPPANDAGEIAYESPDAKESGKRRVYMKLPGGVTMTVTDEDINVEAGSTTINVKVDGDVTIKSNAALKVEATGDMSLTGDNVTIEGKKAVEIKSGTDMKLKAGAGAKVEATTTMDIKGQMVNIN